MAGFIAEHRKRSNAKLLCRITLAKGDITKVDDVQAIVTSVFTNLDITGSLNNSILSAAGHEFDEFILSNIYKPSPGDVFVSKGYDLPVESVIIVVMPAHRDNFDREDMHLLRCYRHAMQMAHKMKLSKIAFPAIGTGIYGYPLDRAVRLALKGISERMTESISEVRIVCKKDEVYSAFKKRLERLHLG
jgi:O-acetyl-ADP-ribose deacetylase (regulator of RNase III)